MSFFILTLLLGCKEDKKVPALELAYVYDNAGLLSENQKDSITQLLKKVDAETTTQFMVYTVSRLNGEDPDAYSIRIAEKLNVGRIFINNGALIFVALEDKNIQLKIGTGLKWQIKNQKASEIVNQLETYFMQNDYYGGINNALNTLIEESNKVDWKIYYTSFAQMEADEQNALGKIMLLNNSLIIDQISGFGGETHFQDTGEEEYKEGIYTIDAVSKTNRSFILKYNRDIIPLLKRKDLQRVVRLYARVTMINPIELRVLGFQRRGDIAEI